MRRSHVPVLALAVLFSVLFTVPSLAQTEKLHGIQVSDMDRAADPCNDFPQYANGTWHKRNPIPGYMDRWSRRWQSGESAKDQLKTILDEVSGRTDWPKSSVNQ